MKYVLHITATVNFLRAAILIIFPFLKFSNQFANKTKVTVFIHNRKSILSGLENQYQESLNV